MSLFSILALALWALATNAYALAKRYFILPNKRWPLRMPFLGFAVCFGFYFFCTSYLAPSIATNVLQLANAKEPDVTSLPIEVISTLQTLLMLLIIGTLFLFLALYPSISLRQIWKSAMGSPSTKIQDFRLGALTWLLAFPLVTLLGEFGDRFVNHFFGPHTYDQAAVQFIKETLPVPFALAMALVSIVLLAPILEELLFRGVLQNFLRDYVGPHSSIVLSALLFTAFHYSPSQGYGNIPLLSALLVLGGYLGFLYERQGSLFATVGLHMTFNAVSALRIILNPATA